jgi:hypothetical protein
VAAAKRRFVRPDARTVDSGEEGESVFTSRAARVGANEDLFRQVNRKVASFGNGHVPYLELVCECSATDCHEHVQLTSQEFEAVRADPRHFAVHPGHVDGRFETAVAGNERFVLVEKLGEAGEVAEALEDHADA